MAHAIVIPDPNCAFPEQETAERAALAVEAADLLRLVNDLAHQVDSIRHTARGACDTAGQILRTAPDSGDLRLPESFYSDVTESMEGIERNARMLGYAVSAYRELAESVLDLLGGFRAVSPEEAEKASAKLPGMRMLPIGQSLLDGTGFTMLRQDPWQDTPGTTMLVQAPEDFPTGAGAVAAARELFEGRFGEIAATVDVRPGDSGREFWVEVARAVHR
ncbi:hypothetical protein [Nonomuraea salmonea]|uniref:WXG100 family type VII secretion target n=1 Tax=Nonomuraea salmonea TaxID=46181 RepID=A0ABV5P349_9ACTN